MFSIISETMSWEGKNLTIETGKIARQADGSVMVKYGDTTVLCTVCFSKKVAEDASFFPLTVNYQEKFYAAGRIPGGYVKREGKPTERETLISRLIDRPIRPLFPDGFLNEVQVVCTTLSYDKECAPEIAAMIGASAALSISGVPFLGPIAGCKVGYDKDSGYILNPTHKSDLDLVVAGTREGILMVESEANELTEDVMLEAVMFGFESFQPVIRMIERLRERTGKPVMDVIPFEEKYRDTLLKIEEIASDKICAALKITEKLPRRDAIEDAKEEVFEALSEEHERVILDALFESILAKTMRKNLLETRKRIDGRALDQIRPITCEIDVLPNVHGSALFTRGETQAMVITTLGSGMDEQSYDTIEGESRESFMLHYNFPPFSVGEVGRLGAPGRREIGHGKLAWRAIHPLIPEKSKFPYTIRAVSEVMESNGSSSMATVCCTSLALMASGVPIREHVAGIAMGLIKEDEYVVLSDIMGDEDHLGDMDFKVAGTTKGITALQMDIKITSITYDILKQALEQANKGRHHILTIMNGAIKEPKGDTTEHAPKIMKYRIDKMKIKDLIGPGGKNIKKICEDTSSTIEISDEGEATVFLNDRKFEKDIASIMLQYKWEKHEGFKKEDKFGKKKFRDKKFDERKDEHKKEIEQTKETTEQEVE